MKAYIKDDFKDLLEYRKWVEDKMNNLSYLNEEFTSYFEKERVENTIKRQESWYGEGATFREMAEGITQYKSPELITRIYDQVYDKISAAVKDSIKARKIKYNPNGIGVFSFDRAAMSMYRLEEYFSEKHQRVVEDREVKQFKERYTFIADNSPVIKRLEQKPDGTPKIRTTSKNVFAYFPSVKTENRAVEMYISCGGDVSVKADAFLYSGVSALIVAQILEKARIKTKISIAIGSSPDGYEKTAYSCLIPVKNYDENLDINLLALLTSDPRFFRFDGFKGIISTYDHFNTKTPFSLGRGMTKDFLIKMIEKSDYRKKRNIPPNRFYFGWTFTEREAISEITKTVNEIAERLN